MPLHIAALTATLRVTCEDKAPKVALSGGDDPTTVVVNVFIALENKFGLIHMTDSAMPLVKSSS